MTYAFLDTNILLHYKVFEGMPWNSILADDNITFIICQKVFDEIDKHKDGDKTRLRNRAKTINKYLISYLDGNPKSSLDIDFCQNPSKVSTERTDFDTSSSDEYIVFAAHEFDSKGNRKLIVTGDGGMKLRARKVGIETLLIQHMPEFLLAQEPTEEEKRIKELEKTIARYTNRCSKPVILFEDETDIISFNKCKISDFSEELGAYRAQLKEQYPHRKPSQQRKGIVLNGLTLATINEKYSPYKKEDYETYNDQIDSFIDKMVNLKQRQLIYSAIDKSIQEVKLTIFNKGTAPTGKMGIRIILPEELTILSEDAFIKHDMTPPAVPQLLSDFDRSMLERADINEMIAASLSHGHYRKSYSHDSVIEEHWAAEPELEKEIFLELPSLNHNLSYILDDSRRLFIPCAKSGTFIIQWAISDESNIDPIVGQLTINIK